MDLLELLGQLQAIVSFAEGRRLLFTGTVMINEKPVPKDTQEIDVKAGDVVRIGKKEFVVTKEHLV